MSPVDGDEAAEAMIRGNITNPRPAAINAESGATTFMVAPLSDFQKLSSDPAYLMHISGGAVEFKLWPLAAKNQTVSSLL
jgi:hypothetical protein